MDGDEGETHVLLGAKIMSIFGKKWHDFSLYHSRFYAKKDNVAPSKLCFADKLAIYYEPSWLYLPRANWSGEIHEYMKLAETRNFNSDQLTSDETKKLASKSQQDWHDTVKSYIYRWVEEHKDGKSDTWTN